MFQRISRVIAAVSVVAVLAGCAGKDPAAERKAKMQAAKERVIRAKTREERVAAQDALIQLQAQEGTFKTQPQSPTTN
jgi:hypothetical protein